MKSNGRIRDDREAVRRTKMVKNVKEEKHTGVFHIDEKTFHRYSED